MHDFIYEDCKGGVLELTSFSREECVALSCMNNHIPFLVMKAVSMERAGRKNL
ncbi:MAG: hypothetical protein IJW96_06005 [Clostridia bacterium]|nr:hypothetical protein [Clostridia bacterium]